MRFAPREHSAVTPGTHADWAPRGARAQRRSPPGPAMPKMAPPDDLVAVQRMIQQSAADRAGPTPSEIQALARSGVRGPSQRLPHADRIQALFGRHDISGVRAHADERAEGAARGMLARAYAVGDHVAFAGPPSLHTAAHEAAHVVQQRAGVSLDGGVGQSGDRYEVHADKVADLVVAGRSAEAALDAMPGGDRSVSGGAIQREESEDALRTARRALRSPDHLGTEATFRITSACTAASAGSKFIAASGTRTLAAGTKLQVISEDRGKTTIRIFEWNQEATGWDQFEGTIPTSAVVLGSTAQTALGEGEFIVPHTPAQIKQSDVFQAGLSDCYLQSALISLANSRPQDIIDMIRDNVRDVEVRLYSKSPRGRAVQEHWIRVDRSLFAGADGKLTYHGKRGRFLWPAFISKAYAILNGGFSEIQMGYSCDAMFALTGRETSLSPLTQLKTDWRGKVKTPAEAFWTYNRIRSNIREKRPVTITTGSFGKSWFKALNNAAKKKGSWAKRGLPSGKVRNIHGYAIFDITPNNLTAKHFATSMPDVTVTLRDPRDEAGATFTRTLKDILTAGKFEQLHYESEP